MCFHDLSLEEPAAGDGGAAGLAGETQLAGAGGEREPGGAGVGGQVVLGDAGHAGVGGGQVEVEAPFEPGFLETGFGELCSVDAWCWEYPLPQGNALNAVWVAGASEVWAAGLAGTLLHYSAGTWRSTYASAGAEAFYGIWGSSPSDLWAVGAGGVIRHWDGSDWSASASGTSHRLTSVSGTAGDDLWVVGEQGTILHNDGSGWKPRPSDRTDALNAVTAIGPNDVWAVGSGGTILAYAGTTWALHAGPTTTSYSAVWGSASEVWVLGTNATAQGLASFWDRTQWDSINTGAVRGIWGAATGELWTVGNLGMVRRREGTSSFVEQLGSHTNLQAVHGIDAGEVWAVGQGGSVYRRSNGVWAPVSSGTDDGLVLYDLWSDGADALVVGSSGRGLRLADDSWKLAELGTGELRSVAGPTSSDLWAVGVAGNLQHFDGEAWTRVESGMDQTLYAVDTDRAGGAWAVGEAGTTLHFDGEAWGEVPSGVVVALHSVWVADSRSAWAVGDGGTALVYEGGSWQQVSTGTGVALRAAHGTARDDVWAVGRGKVLHFDGSRWSAVNLGSLTDLRSVFAVTPEDVWFGGELGRLYRWNGQAIEPVQSGMTQTIVAIRGFENGAVLVGQDGAVLRYVEP